MCPKLYKGGLEGQADIFRVVTRESVGSCASNPNRSRSFTDLTLNIQILNRRQG
jgi:hypothetical protein